MPHCICHTVYATQPVAHVTRYSAADEDTSFEENSEDAAMKNNEGLDCGTQQAAATAAASRSADRICIQDACGAPCVAQPIASITLQ
jgi:hypothetical protein